MFLPSSDVLYVCMFTFLRTYSIFRFRHFLLRLNQFQKACVLLIHEQISQQKFIYADIRTISNTTAGKPFNEYCRVHVCKREGRFVFEMAMLVVMISFIRPSCNIHNTEFSQLKVFGDHPQSKKLAHTVCHSFPTTPK